MAFTGTPTFEQINDRTCRITGVSLGANASGTIGLAGATGGAPDITLPSNLGASPYPFQGAVVPLTASIVVTVEPAGAAALTNLPVSRSKAGTTIGTWRTTITNTNAGLATQSLEIYVEFMGAGKVSQPAVVSSS